MLKRQNAWKILILMIVVLCLMDFKSYCSIYDFTKDKNLSSRSRAMFQKCGREVCVKDRVSYFMGNTEKWVMEHFGSPDSKETNYSFFSKVERWTYDVGNKGMVITMSNGRVTNVFYY